MRIVEQDYIGRVYGKLTIVSPAPPVYSSGRRRRMWHCRCVCGKEIEVYHNHIKTGHTQSCGCIKGTHKLSNTRLYSIWEGMVQRTGNCKNKDYKNYGGRGICICSLWRQDFKSFYEWAISNSYADTLSIDRINNNGDYTPDNCKWTTKKVQNRNHRRNHMLTYKNKTMCMVEWCELLGLQYKRTSYRIHKGWATEDAFEIPVGKRRKK